MTRGDRTPIHGVLLDVDGTLYHAGRLRRRIATRLAALPLAGPRRAVRVGRNLRAFRRALEDVRHEEPGRRPLLERHRERAVELGADPDSLSADVEHWMERVPLRHLRSCRRAGLEAFMDGLADRGVRVGFFSDYPVEAKLVHLGLDPSKALCLSARDPRINAYKPWPHGFRFAAETWCLAPAHVLYIGDRIDTDAIGAAAAGMRAAILSRRPSPTGELLEVTGFDALAETLEDLLP